MCQQLFKALYCSRNFIEGDQATKDAEISRILEVARVNNSQQDVTGALLFNSGYFAQALEGPKPAIERIFEKIQRDARHGDVTILETGYADKRDFSEWSMAYVHPPTEQEATGIAVTLDHALLHPAASANAVLDLLRNLVVQDF